MGYFQEIMVLGINYRLYLVENMMLLTGIESQMLVMNRSLPGGGLLYNRVMLQPLGAGGATIK